MHIHQRSLPNLLLLCVTSVSLCLCGSPAPSQAKSDATMQKAQQAVARGMDYLRRTQEKDGSWSEYPATTALAVTGFLRNGKTELNEPAVAKGIKYILRATKPNGAIYSDANPATALPNYNTCLCVMALALTKNPAYKTTIQKAQKYLESSQFDEGENVKPGDPTYGGIGYGSDPDDHPDLGNLQTALEALKDTGTPADAPVWKKAIIFIQRVQNRKESNDQAWSKDSPNDGGFVYDSTGESKIPGGTGHTSMGAMTYAGVKSYIYAGVSKNDPRVQAAWSWIRGHYTVTEHPGMGDTSLYYYYHTMAKTLDVYGQKRVQDTKGQAHDWQHELAAQIVSVQHPDGSWYNNNSRYWENQPGLVTSYSLITLSYCLKK
ncbi:MAG TPA: prenyltransferase/squalene oxidase repeat-containing protein [Chthonomonadaceae bacterium]|nr:prenyltransferase/squalene oxidase repeat-containing protein [Chthonomonadaceae bacterium]